MEVISIIVMFLFGNMNDTENKMTQYIPMENLSSCLKEKRILARNKEFEKAAKGYNKEKKQKKAEEFKKFILNQPFTLLIFPL